MLKYRTDRQIDNLYGMHPVLFSSPKYYYFEYSYSCVPVDDPDKGRNM
jgi:hypothetical protein